jgi:uncharacterized membrane protein YphA (DoxX/SURF4 family)
MSLNRWVVLAFRTAVGGVFLWAGMIKMLDPLAFARGIEAYRLFPRPAAFFLALTLPAVEVACGALLVLGLLRRPAALLASAMSAGFIVLVAATMVRGLDVTCGCFGSFSGKADARLLVQDAVLLALSLAVLLSRRDPLSLDELSVRRRRPPA